MQRKNAPKLFISYSWTSSDHEQFILKLATELRGAGVDVVLDKWDLKEGHDAYVFMERMVGDPNIQKVALICDRSYVEKANGRSGGVGAETQIITADLYGKTDQNKFVAVVVERDEHGKPCVPTYYKSRIYIDLVDASLYPENFDRLLRWVYGKPIDVRPALGKMPRYLASEKVGTASSTAALSLNAIAGLRAGRETAVASLTEYFEALPSQFDELRLDPKVKPFDDAVIESVGQTLPLRNEVLEVLHTVALHRGDEGAATAVHHLFESLIPFLSPPADATIYREDQADNLSFLIHELFLYALAVFLKRERFVAAALLVHSPYYSESLKRISSSPVTDFTSFREYLRSFEERGKRLNLRRASLRADMLKERAVGAGLSFNDLMQADFILFLVASLHGDKLQGQWWPETLLYAGRSSSAFEVFARSRSATYFNKVKAVLGVNGKAELEVGLTKMVSEGRLPRWDFVSVQPQALTGIQQIASRA